MTGYLPESVLERRKTPLAGYPFSAFWRLSGVPGWLLSLAHEPALASFVDREALDVAIAANVVPEAAQGLYYILTLALWLRVLGTPR